LTSGSAAQIANIPQLDFVERCAADCASCEVAASDTQSVLAVLLGRAAPGGQAAMRA
jgi:hypothetical protein